MRNCEKQWWLLWQSTVSALGIVGIWRRPGAAGKLVLLRQAKKAVQILLRLEDV